MLRIQLLRCLVFTLALTSFLFADVWPTVAGSGTSVSIKNNTNNAWTLGGVRYINNGWEWTTVPDAMQASWFAMVNVTQGSNNEVSLYMKSNAPSNNTARLTPSDVRSFIVNNAFPWGTPEEIKATAYPVDGTEQLLLRTSSQGLVDNPESEPGITLKQLDSLSKTPDFYREDYRPDIYDSLGSRGGRYSGGLLDTWLGETQMQLAIPTDKIHINGTDVTVDKSPTLYWMAGALAQEYFDVDMQVLVTQGAKETFSGMAHPMVDPNVNINVTEYTSYHIEAPSGLDRALSYPKLFPEYELRLASAADVTTSGITDTEFMDFYIRPGGQGSAKLNSAASINGALLTSLFRLNAYDMLSTATDICWKEGLEASYLESANDPNVDPYTGLGIILYSYVNGMWGAIGSIAGIYNETFDPAAYDRLALGTGNNNYVPENLNLAQKFIDASRESLTNPAVEILDIPITREEMHSVYFGDGGTVADQGVGGLLLHFLDGNTAMRQLIWDKIDAGFDILKGRAPGVGAEEISLRYDFLPLLRVVKDDIDFSREYRIAGDAATLIPQYSTGNVSCNGTPLDDIYPNIATSSSYDLVNDQMVVEVNGTDNAPMKSCKWSIDYKWSTWGKAVEKSKNGNNDITFEIRVDKATIESFQAVGDGESGYYMWVMITDSAGNSTVSKIPTNIEIPKEPVADSASALDDDGDGQFDKIEVYLTPSKSADADAIGDVSNFKYSWPTDVLDKSGTPTASGNVLTMSDAAITEGAGLGKVSFDYPSKSGYSLDVEDRIGPAISVASILMEDSRLFDTLTITVSEKIAKYDKPNFLYCQFKKGSDIHDILAQQIEKVSDYEYRVYFAKEDLIDEDSVRFAYETDPLEDEVGNKPASNNQWVKINFKGGKEPEFKSAAMFDTDGDGDGDSLKIELTLGGAVDKYTVSDISGGSYSWPGISLSETFNTSSFVDATDDAFSYMYDVTEGAGSGRFEIDFTGGYKINNEIADKVGPAILTAVLSIQDENRDKDTLWLTVTEELANIGQSNHEYCYLKVGSTESKEISSSVEKESEKVYKFIFDKGLVADKDSVKFVYDNSPVEDAVGNVPMDINQRIEIKVVGGKEPKLTSANMYDIDGDGRGDSVRVTLKLGSAKDKYTTADILGGTYSWPGISLSETLTTGDMLSKNESAFSFLYDSDRSAGSGYISMDFPDNAFLRGEINDKVGPVIDSAICLQQDTDRDKDTLLIETSEVLENNFSENVKYIILFEDSSATNGDTISVDETELLGIYYRMIIAKNTVEYGDWVQFVYDSGIEDEAGNRPLAINQKVKINVKGAVVPNIGSAGIYDKYGANDLLDGHGDSIWVDLELSDDPKALTVDSLKEVEYTWNGVTNTIAAGSINKVSQSRFSIVNKSLTGGSGTGSITLNFINENYSVTGDLNDKVAPVIISAKYYNWSSANDTLIVTFSEELSKDGSDNPFSLSSGKNLTVKSQKVDGATVTYSIEGSDEVAYGDSIWITGDENITDSENNEQAVSDNVHILINYKRVVTATAAEYLDSDSRPDGFIDEVLITFDEDVDGDLTVLTGNVKLPAERFFTIGTATATGDEVTVEVTQDRDQAAINTAIESYDKLSISYVEGSDTLCFISDGEITIEDKLAPVIVSARFEPSEETEGTLIDILSITYSEKVRETNQDEPFTMSDASNVNSEYTLEVDGSVSGKDAVRYENEYSPANVLPGAGDSIWIDQNGEIEDEAGNEQLKNSAPVELVVGKYNRDFEVWVTPTPYDMSNYEDSALVSIRILPKTRKLPDDIRAKAVIYDKVGNVIMKISSDDFGEIENESLTYSFLPANEKGRRLGEGSYLVKVLVETGDSEIPPYTPYLFIKGKVPGTTTDDNSEEE